MAKRPESPRYQSGWDPKPPRVLRKHTMDFLERLADADDENKDAHKIEALPPVVVTAKTPANIGTEKWCDWQSEWLGSDDKLRDAKRLLQEAETLLSTYPATHSSKYKKAKRELLMSVIAIYHHYMYMRVQYSADLNLGWRVAICTAISKLLTLPDRRNEPAQYEVVFNALAGSQVRGWIKQKIGGEDLRLVDLLLAEIAATNKLRDKELSNELPQPEKSELQVKKQRVAVLLWALDIMQSGETAAVAVDEVTRLTPNVAELFKKKGDKMKALLQELLGAEKFEKLIQNQVDNSQRPA